MSKEGIVFTTITIILYLVAMYIYFVRSALKEVNDLRIRRKTQHVSPSYDERMAWAFIVLAGICVAMFAGLIALVAMKFIPIVP